MQNNKLLFLIIVLLSFCFLLFVPEEAYAGSTTIIINEFLYDPDGPDHGYEWIELKNISNEEINLQAWQIQIAGTGFDTEVVLPNYPIHPGQILLIGEGGVPNTDIKASSISMQNGGSATDGVRLVDNEGHAVDSVFYDRPNMFHLYDDTGNVATKFAPDVSGGHSLSRISADDTDDSEADFTETETPTPGQENYVPPHAVITAPDTAYLDTEVSISGTESNDLDGTINTWYWNIFADDVPIHESTEETFTLMFEEENTYTIELTVTDDDGHTDTATKDISVEQDPENPIITEINSAKRMPEGSDACIEAIVTAPLKTLFDKEIYVQDETTGIRAKIPVDSELDINVPYRLCGFIDTTYGEIRINVDSVLPSNKNLEIKPVTLNPDSIGPEYIGQLVTTSIVTEQKRGSYLYGPEDATGTAVRIYIPDSVTIEVPSDIKGSPITVTGILSQYGTDEEGNPKMRIMPRFNTDIILSAASETEHLGNTGTEDIITILLGSTWATVLTTRKVIKKENL